MATNYRLLHRMSHSKLFRSFLTQKYSLTTSSKLLSITTNQQYHLFDTNVYKKHSFSTKASKDSDSDSDDDSDDSDDSDSDFDFTDSDDSDDSDVEDNKKQKNVSESFENQKAQNKKTHEFKHDNVSPEMLMKDRLIISNLNFSTNRNDLWELCENYGTVTDVHLPANRNRDFHNRGFGFVTFETNEMAQNALDNVAGIMFNSRQLRAGFARIEERTSANNYSSDNSFAERSKSKSEFSFNPNTNTNAQSSDFGVVENKVLTNENSISERNEVVNINQGMTETAITINGLPGTINLAQITKMFSEFGIITNITFSPYRMYGHSFMNAIVCIKLREENETITRVENVQQQQQRVVVDDVNEGKKEEAFTFQETEVKDRSIDKTDSMAIRRRNVGGGGGGVMDKQSSVNQGNRNKQVGGIDPDVLAKEIDDLLADTSDEDSDSDSSSDSDSDTEEDKK